METHPVDEAIERYVRERMERGEKAAGERFLSYARLRYQGRELAEFLQRTIGMLRYYINFFRLLSNPFKGPELAFFSTALSIALFGSFMLTDPDERNLGCFIVAGALVNGWSIIRYVIRNWCDLSVLIAIYNEILALAEQELRSETAAPQPG